MSRQASRQPSHAEQAADLLDQVHRLKVDPTGPALNKEALIQEALAHAVLAVAKELAAVREQVGEVEAALRGPDEDGAGMSLHYISDWLEKISRK